MFTMPKKVSLFTKISIVVLCFVFYGNTLNNDYSMDDEYVIVNNAKVEQGIGGIPTIFTSHYIENERQSFAYRPVTLAVFAIEYQFFGANPFVSHLINLLLYALTCLLLFGVLTRLFREYHWLLPVLVVALFLIHPIHSEVVNNIKSRDELLSFLFALLALRTAISYVSKRNILYLLLALVLMGVSLLAKLSSLTFLAIIPLSLYFFENLKGRKLVLIIGSFILVYLAFKAGSNQLLDSETKARELLFMENPLFTMEGNIVTRIPAAFYTVGYYIKLLVWPYPLLFYYGYDHVPIVGWNSIWAWGGILVLLPLGVYTVLKLKTKHVLIFGLAFFFISISMFSNLVRPAVGIIAERFAYIPSLGFCIVLAYLLLKVCRVPVSEKEKPWNRKPILIGAVSLLTVVAGAHVLDRNNDWESKTTLTRNDSKHLKRSAKANALLGDYLLGDMSKAQTSTTKKQLGNSAIFYYKRSLEIHNDNGPVYNNLGVINHELGNYEEAISYIRRAHGLGTVTGNSYYNLGAAFYMNGDLQNAANSFESSIARDPNYINSYTQLMLLYSSIQQYGDAFEVNLRALTQFPSQRVEIVKSGQRIAEAQHGAGTDSYINLLLERGFIDQNLYDRFKQELTSE